MRIHLKTCFVFFCVGVMVTADEREEQLFKAAKLGDAKAIQELLAAKVDVNAKNKYEATALSFACDRGHLEIARMLIEAGADINVKDRFYKSTPLDSAAGGKHHAIVRLLLQRGAKGADYALRTAAGNGSVETVRAVLETSEIKPEMLADCRSLASDRKHKEIVALIEKSIGDTKIPTVDVPLDVLKSYVGDYESDEGWEFKIELKDDKLRIGSPYRSPVSMRAVDEKTFKYFSTNYVFTTKDDAVSFTRKASSREMVFRRVTKDNTAESPNTPVPSFSPEVVRADLLASSPNWPQFRGKGARGIADGQNAPSRWDVEKSLGVQWKTPIAGLAHSCPIVWGDQIFLTTAASDKDEVALKTGIYGNVDSVDDHSPHKWQIICLDLRSGKLNWQRTARESVPTVKRHPKSTHANCTPVTNGRQVVALFGSEGLYCYDMEGRLQWKKTLGNLDSGWFYDDQAQWGFASSPVIYDESVIVQCDVQKGSFIAAYDLESGDEIWKTDRDEIPTWCSPTIYSESRVELLITGGTNFARGYDPRDGKELWKLSGHSEIAVPTPFVAGELIFVTSGYRPVKPIYAIRPTARGDISLKDDQTSNDHIAWSQQKGGPYLPTPIVYRGYLYVCSNTGILTCYDAMTGDRKYQQRVRGGGAKSFSASLVAADDKVYITSEEGVVLVVAAGPTYKLLHTNPAGEYCLATPAIVRGSFLLRTQHHLLSLGKN